MAGVFNIQGSGLAMAQRALAQLEEHPEQLDRERRRFSESPPSYQSSEDMSGTTTRSESPNAPTEEQQRRQQRRMQLVGERQASLPGRQFEVQVEKERRRIWNADARTSWIDLAFLSSDLDTFQEEARIAVKKAWVEQGIWNNKWTYFTIGVWKHQEPLEIESESETDIEAASSRPLFPLLPEESKPRRQKSNKEKRRIEERRVVREREREASRPYHQFVYQVSKEREQIQGESANRGSADASDINTKAYEIVKNTWTKQGLWKTKWGILPGMSWKHEEPLEDEAADLPIPVSETALRNAQPPVNQEAANGAFAPPFQPLSPVDSTDREPSAVMTTSQQGLSADILSAGLENSDAEHHPSAPKSPRRRAGKQVLRPTKGQVLGPNRRNQSQKDGQPQLVASASLGPAHPTKVSKAASKTKPGRKRRLSDSYLLPSGSIPFSSDVNAAEPQPSPPPDRVTPRRSKRIKPPVST